MKATLILFLIFFQLSCSLDIEKIREILKVSKFWNSVCPSLISIGHIKMENLNKNDISHALKAYNSLEKKFVFYRKNERFENYLFKKTPVNSKFDKIVEKLNEQISENLCDAKDFKLIVPESLGTVACDKVRI